MDYRSLPFELNRNITRAFYRTPAIIMVTWRASRLDILGLPACINYSPDSIALLASNYQVLIPIVSFTQNLIPYPHNCSPLERRKNSWENMTRFRAIRGAFFWTHPNMRVFRRAFLTFVRLPNTATLSTLSFVHANLELCTQGSTARNTITLNDF